MSSGLVGALPWLALALGLAATAWVWSALKAQVADESRARFQYRASQITDALHTRLQAYRLVLQGGAALFAASSAVSRAEWHAYVDALDLEVNYPGIQGIGYALHIPAGQRDRVIATMRADGLPGFTVWPEAERADYTAIVYLEPASGRNLRAFGYDMHSEPVRRNAMDRARDTGLPALSGKVTLVQETDQDVQAGFLMYVPVYRNGLPTGTVAQRRTALLGWVYAPFRMADFMAGLLGPGPILNNEVDLEVFDGEAVDAAALMWDYDDSGRWRGDAKGALSEDTVLRSDGHAWTLHMETTAAFQDHASRWKPDLALLAGLVGSLLLFALAATLARTRRRALDIARQMTSALTASEERYRQMFMTNQAVKLLIDPVDQRVVDANPAAAQFYGYPLERLLTMKISDLNTLPPEAIAREIDLAQSERRLHFNFRHRLANGEVRDVEVYSGPVHSGERTLLYSIVHDVTARNRAVAEQRAVLATAQVGLAHVNERRWIWVNTGMEQMFGHTLAELQGISTELLYASAEDYRRVGQEAYPALLEGRHYDTETRMRRRDGSTFWCRMSGCLIDQEQPELGSIWVFSDIDDTVRAKAELIALNERLRQLTLRDPLTGLYNRRHMEEALAHEIAVAERKGRQLALIMLDIDHFKLFNDRFGHEAGDVVLREIAGVMARQVRTTDAACRYGGEEFLILMPESDLATAMQRAQRLREGVQSLLLDYHGQPLGRITLSLGVAVYPDHADNGQSLVAAADAALYRAKQGGRNRVEGATA
jgi:diguanylate cyclase (GGDEF)-like protein/PAS domain S-box-containing protein